MAAVCCRSIRRGKHDIPDYYPQSNNQKEDELTEENVKRGYTNHAVGNLTPHEYSSAQDSLGNVPISKFATAFNDILIEKQKANTFQDVNKKKPQAQSKDFFLPITSKTKSHASSWLQELADGKSLSVLENKKVPIFNKKEELLNSVCEYSVPLVRATWFIKMTAAHQMVLISDSRNKKRQASDPAQEWTSTLTKYLKDQVNKLSDFYHQSYQRMSEDVELAQKQWHYAIRLTDWLYEENLLDRQEFFHWLVELMEKMKNDDVILKLILPVVLRYLDQIVHSQVLSKNLALCCARKLSSLLSAAEQMRDEQKQTNTFQSNSEPSPTNNANQSTKSSTTDSKKNQSSLFAQYKPCAYHQSLVNGLSCILQVITICCPGALIWNTSKTGTSNEQASKKGVSGSALDRLPLSPCELPLPATSATPEFNKQIEAVLMLKEEEIKSRSKAVERRWFVDINKTSAIEVNKIVDILDYLDKQNFNKVERVIATDDIYEKIFSTLPKDDPKMSSLDEAICILLIQWAISAQRVGKHRAIIVSTLLKRRQTELREQFEKHDGEEEDETMSKGPSSGLVNMYFQNVSLKFLDDYAPVWDEEETSDSRFKQLVMLYGELIRLDVFSHNSYLCTLISRGDLETSKVSQTTTAMTTGTENIISHEANVKSEGRHHELLHDSISEDIDRSTDSTNELNKQLGIEQELMLHQEQLQKLLYQDSGSPDDGLVSPFNATTGFDEFKSEKARVESVSTELVAQPAEKSQHHLYVKHFPIPKEENTHELNQRLVVLYGVGKPRQTAIKAIKEMGRELVTFITNMGEIACKELDDDHTKSINNRKQALYRKFSTFPIFDQYSWVAKCLAIVRELASSHPDDYGLNELYPTFGQLSFLIELFEMCSNIHDLLEFLVDLLEVRNKMNINVNVPQETSVYGTLPTKPLLVLATLRKHQSILLLNSALALKTFFGFLRTVENISDPAVCTSTERCVLAYLYYLYTSCTYVKSKFIENFDTACNKIKENIITFSNSLIGSSSLPWDGSFLSSYFENSRKEKLDVIWKELMSQDRPEEMYSFICNAISNVYSCQDRERLYDLGALSSEVTAHYKVLSSEWIIVLKALCCFGNSGNGYIELSDEVDINDTSFHESICIFTTVLVTRSCFSLEDLICHALLPALSDAVDSGNKIILEAEAGVQLACQLFYRLLNQSTDMSQDRFSVEKFSYEQTPDKALLEAAQENVNVGVLFDVLKAIMKVSEAESRGNDTDTGLNGNDDIFSRNYYNTIDDLIDVGPGQANDVFSSSMISNKSGIESTNASSYAKNVLHKLCGQEWLKDKCLHDQNILFSSEGLLDPNITDSQAERLLHLICHATGSSQSFNVADEFPSSMESCKEAADRILTNLNRWSFRNSWLELYLMLTKANKEKREALLNSISSACLKVFLRPHNSAMSHDAASKSELIRGPEWLVEPLIAKLPRDLRGRVLKTAAEVLGVKCWWKNKTDSSGSRVIHTQPFLHLILSSLETFGEQKESLLMSLLKQFQELLEQPIDENNPTDRKTKAFIQEALDLRLRLVGVMFDSIANSKNLQRAVEWAVVLFELISCGILSSDHISGALNHYTNVLDMLSVLINLITSTETTTNQLGEDGRKLSAGLFKRLKRKLHGKNPSDIEHCKQLLPFPGRSIEVVTVEKTHNNDVSIFSESQSSTMDGEEAREGLQVNGRQRISPWDLIEGHKNPAPMLFSWFGAVRMERKLLPHQKDLPQSHLHNFGKRKPLSYYLNPPDDSDDESIDLNTMMLDSPDKLQSTLDPRGRGYSSMINLNAAVKRERLELRDITTDYPNDDEPKLKRQKRITRTAQHPLVVQQKLLQEEGYPKQNQLFKSERLHHQGQNPDLIGIQRLQRPTGKTFNVGQPIMLLPKPQGEQIQRNPTGIQSLVFTNRAQSIPIKSLTQHQLLGQQSRAVTASGIQVVGSPMQQLLQSSQSYQFNSGQNPQLTITNPTILSAAPSSLSGSPSLATSLSNVTFPVSGSNNPCDLQRQMSAPAKLSVSSHMSNVSYSAPIASRTTNLNQQGDTQEFNVFH